ncbi:unnamed protein product [Amoebophrya sp. A120]|nr:unnamed protein product [Amoebophrya sp. A120]|eukprot:GSA120T00009356001.1
MTAATAAGVCATFGAPLGATLFAMEMATTFFFIKNIWRAFFCSVSCLFALRVCGYLHVTRLFELTDLGEPPLEETGWFVLLGVCNGVVGALVVKFTKFCFGFSARLLTNNQQQTTSTASMGGAPPESRGLLSAKNALHGKIFLALMLISLFSSSLCVLEPAIAHQDKSLINALFSKKSLSEKLLPGQVSGDIAPGGAAPGETGAGGNEAKSAKISSRSSASPTSVSASSDLRILTSLIFQKSILFPIAAACPIPAGVFTPVFVLGASLGRLFGLVFRFPKTSEEDSDFFWALPQSLNLGPSALFGETNSNNPSGHDHEDGAALSTTGSQNQENDGTDGSFQKTLQSYFESVDAAAQGWFGTQDTGEDPVPATSNEVKQPRKTSSPEDSFTRSPPPPSDFEVPALYAVVGATCMTAGVTQMLSTVLIVSELTGQINHLLPMLLAVCMSYFVCGYLLSVEFRCKKRRRTTASSSTSSRGGFFSSNEAVFPSSLMLSRSTEQRLQAEEEDHEEHQSETSAGNNRLMSIFDVIIQLKKIRFFPYLQGNQQSYQRLTAGDLCREIPAGCFLRESFSRSELLRALKAAREAGYAYFDIADEQEGGDQQQGFMSSIDAAAQSSTSAGMNSSDKYYTTSDDDLLQLRGSTEEDLLAGQSNMASEEEIAIQQNDLARQEMNEIETAVRFQAACLPLPVFVAHMEGGRDDAMCGDVEGEVAEIAESSVLLEELHDPGAVRQKSSSSTTGAVSSGSASTASPLSISLVTSESCGASRTVSKTSSMLLAAGTTAISTDEPGVLTSSGPSSNQHGRSVGRGEKSGDFFEASKDNATSDSPLLGLYHPQDNLLDPTPLLIDEQTSLARVHFLFLMLSLEVLFVTRRAPVRSASDARGVQIAGVITRESFFRATEKYL